MPAFALPSFHVLYHAPTTAPHHYFHRLCLPDFHLSRDLLLTAALVLCVRLCERMQALHSTNLGVCQCWVQNGADFYNQFVVGQACGASNASQYVTTLWDRPHLPSLSICPTFAPSLNLGLYRYPCSSYVFCEQCLSVYCMNGLGRPSLLTVPG
jgi:hypothetical protein